MSSIEKLSFETSLYYKDLQITSELENFCKSETLDEIPAEHSTSFFKEQQIELSNLLMPNIKDFFTEVGHSLGYSGMVLNHTWIQKYHVGDNHRIHIHSVYANDYSFVLYIDCDETSANTVFYNFGYPYIDHGVHKIKPKKGRCVLFPGAMPHEAQSNKDEVRLIVSGNVSFNR